MARYTAEHKEKIRARLLREASRLFRRHGYDGVGIEEIMAAAGLTRGGFYRHFRSKAELYAEAMSGEHDFIERMRARSGTTRRQLARQGEAIALAYLEPSHRPGVIRGCSLAALAMETTRRDVAAKRAYADVLRKLAAEFARGLEEPTDATGPTDPTELDDRALAAIVLCVGGLLTSSAAGDPELAERISRVAQQRVRSVLAEPGADSRAR